MPFTMFNITTGIEFPNASPYKIKKLKKDEWRVYTENKNRGENPFECQISVDNASAGSTYDMLEKKRGFVEKQGTNKIVSLSSFPKTELRGDAIKIKAFNSECRILTIKIIISAFFGANVILTANSVYEKSAPKGFFDNLSEVLKCLKFYGNRLPIDTISAKNLKSKLASLNRSAKTVDMTPEIEVVSDADKGGLIILKGKFKSGREYSETIKPADLTGMQKKAEAENIEEPFKPAKEWYTGKAVSRKVYKAFI